MSDRRFQLLVLSDQRRGERIPLESDEVSIGRSDAVGIKFDNPSVSRSHAVLRRHAGRLMIEDIGSSGGTRVNNTQIDANRAVEVENGDELVFGSFHTQLLEIDEYDDQFDDGEMTMFGSAADLPDDLDEILARCEQPGSSKNGAELPAPESKPAPAPAVSPSPAPAAAPVDELLPMSAEPPANPYKSLTIILSVMLVVLLCVTLMAVFKWPVDLTALLK